MLHIYLLFRFAPNIKGLEFHHFLYLHVAYDVEYVFIRLIIIWLFQLTNHLVIAIHNSIINIIKIFIDFNHQLMRNHISFMILLLVICSFLMLISNHFHQRVHILQLMVTQAHPRINRVF